MTHHPSPAATVIGRLSDHFGERLATAHAIREQHGRDLSRMPPALPDAVVFVESEDEVRRIVTACFEHSVPVVPYGAGSSVEGHTIAVGGGISIDMSRMNRIVEVHVEDGDAVVEAGVTRKQLNAHLRDTGLTFPIDPGADASLGGMASTRASGTTAVRYGTMRENVLGLRVVRADGSVIHTGTRARKSSTGYDLTRLFVGAEGTLGVITELTVRLHPIPECVASAICAFETVEGAVNTVIQTIQLGVPIARVEFLDETAIHATNLYSKLGLRETPTLFLEFHGSPRGVEEQPQTVEAIAEENGGSGFAWSTKEEERARLWQARHDAFYSNRALRPGCDFYTTDTCVPISRLAESIRDAKADIAASPLNGKVIGHVGDGNFHISYLIEPGNQEELAEAERLADRLVERTLKVGGTATRSTP